MIEGTRIQVGLLEDHQILREGLEALLVAADLELAVSTGDPEEFVARVAAAQLPVALIDLTLSTPHGVVDGLTVLTALRDRSPPTKVLVLSACSDPERLERCYRQGASGFLSKLNASEEVLRGAIAAVLRGERVFPLELLPRLQRAPSARRPAGELDSLTPREREVLAHVTVGHDNLKIAAQLNISERTVKAHVGSLYRKVEAENRVELALLGRRCGLSLNPP